MRNIAAIASRELRSYFSSPIAYILIGFFLLPFGVFFYLYLNNFVKQSMQMAQFGRFASQPGEDILDLLPQVVGHLLVQFEDLLAQLALPASDLVVEYAGLLLEGLGLLAQLAGEVLGRIGALVVLGLDALGRIRRKLAEQRGIVL